MFAKCLEDLGNMLGEMLGKQKVLFKFKTYVFAWVQFDVRVNCPQCFMFVAVVLPRFVY